MKARFATNARRAHWMLLLVIVVSSSGLLLRGLDSDYIALWDEVVHLNVVQNLVTDCCTPRLHMRELETDHRDWTDNNVWLHKPPLPFLMNAAFAAGWPRSPLAMRLPSLVFAEAIVVLVFLVGLRFFDSWSATLAAAGFAFNHYTFELVQGRQFSGIPDLTLVCFLMGALYCLLAIAEHPQRKHFMGFGLFAGLAFLCKDGLALVPFAVLAAVVLRLGWRQHAAGFLYATSIALLIAGSSTAYLTFLFPVEATYEQQHRVAHLFGDVEGWSRPVDYYFSVYFSGITSPLIAGVGLLCVAWGILRWASQPGVAILALWILSYLVFLSAGVSKVSNFIYPTAPVLYLLMAVLLTTLWRRADYQSILAGSSTILATAVILQFDLFGSLRWIGHSATPLSRFGLPLFQWVVFGASLAALRMAPVRPVPKCVAASACAAVLVALGASVRANLAAPDRRPRDFDHQLALRQAALALPRHLDPHAIVLVRWDGVMKSHLYVKFWSGLESLEVNERHPLEARLALVKREPAVYLLADSALPSYAPPVRVGQGYLHKMK